MKQVDGLLKHLERKLEAPWQLIITPTGLSMRSRIAVGEVQRDASLTNGSKSDEIVPALLAVARSAGYDGQSVAIVYLGFGESLRFRYDLRTEEGTKAWQRKVTQDIEALDSGISVAVLKRSSGACLVLRPRNFELQLDMALRKSGFEASMIEPLAVTQLSSIEQSPGIQVTEQGGYCSVLLVSHRGPEVQFVWPEASSEEVTAHWLPLCHAVSCPNVVLRIGDEAGFAHKQSLVESLAFERLPRLGSHLLDLLAPRVRSMAIAGGSLLFLLAAMTFFESKLASAQQEQKSREVQSQKAAMNHAAERARLERWIARDWAHRPVSPLLAAAGESPPKRVTFKSARQLAVSPPTLVVEGMTPEASPVRDWLDGLPKQEWPARGKLVKLAPPQIRDSSGFMFQVVLESP